jgi:arabinose-5-phosphate isomerase
MMTPQQPDPNDTPAGSARDAALLDQGRQIIMTEARALDALAQSLDHGFVRAIRTIIATKGRVVVTGMGKSGHVARKIAATLAATGTPALFLHPDEAAHGDLGKLTATDALLALSNSGSTPEVLVIMRYARAIGCPIIAIGARANGPVMQAADIALRLPPAREACPVNIAPTTSTTMMIALGDALAVSVMGLRGISREGIRLLHPGGSIGASLMLVDDLMHTGDRLPLVARHMPMREVLVVMTEKSLGIAGVVDRHGHLIGVITDGDLRRHIDTLIDSRADAVMTPDPRTIIAGSYAGDARAALAQARITALFVVAPNDPQRPIGVVHIHDLARCDIAIGSDAIGSGAIPAVTPDWDAR